MPDQEPAPGKAPEESARPHPGVPGGVRVGDPRVVTGPAPTMHSPLTPSRPLSMDEPLPRVDPQAAPRTTVLCASPLGVCHVDRAGRGRTRTGRRGRGFQPRRSVHRSRESSIPKAPFGYASTAGTAAARRRLLRIASRPRSGCAADPATSIAPNSAGFAGLRARPTAFRA